LKDDVEKPSDIDGVLYIPMDDRGAWKSEVAREMKKAGLDFNLEALLYN
jgi:predicted nucleotide-binding protein